MNSRGFTGTLARLASQHPWRIVSVWIALVLLGGIIASVFPASYSTAFEIQNDPESQRGAELIEERMQTGEPSPDELVVVASDTLTVDSPEFQAFVADLVEDIVALDDLVQYAVTVYQTGNESLVSDDRQATVIPVFLQEEDPDIHPLLNLLEERDEEEGFTVVTGGAASIDIAFIETSESDLLTGETIGISVALLVLVLVFGALVAAGIPLAMAVTAILISVGITALVGRVQELSIFVINMMIMVGLAVGIDYTLFVVGRYREERQNGLSLTESIVRTGETATKAVFFSGLTVVTALIGMLLVPSSIFRSLGVGAIIVVIISVLAILTLLPAVLQLVGDGIERGRGRTLMIVVGIALLGFAGIFSVIEVGRNFIAAYLGAAAVLLLLALFNINPFRRRSATQGPNFWDRSSRFVMNHPIPLVSLTTIVLVAVSVVYFTIEIGESGISTLPDENTSYRAYTLINERFSELSLESPNQIVIDAADVSEAEIRSAIEDLIGRIENDPAFGPVSVSVNEDGDLAVLTVPATSDTRGTQALNSIERLREDYIPQTFSGVDAEVLVTGPSAFSLDFNQVVYTYTPIVFAFVLSVSLILLLLAFRSLVVPIKSVLMNLLSVGGSYGLLVLVFQHGVGNEIFGFQQVERIDAWIPLMMFTILFGLSMDYHVFLLSRIREHYDHSGSNTDSVAYGLRTTASMITGAALIMVAVFGGFAMGDLAIFQQIGFGLAIAVILDATVVRSILVPASMRLLGDWNWYFPRWLEWLPHVNIEGEPSHAPLEPASADD